MCRLRNRFKVEQSAEMPRRDAQEFSEGCCVDQKTGVFGDLAHKKRSTKVSRLEFVGCLQFCSGDFETDTADICDSASIFLQVASSVTLSSSTSLAVVAVSNQDRSAVVERP